MERIHLIVSGMVQGVGFRWFVEDRARELGLVGWVRNLPNGNVEVVAEGNRERLDQLITRCREGPPYSHVVEVTTEWQSATGEIKDFRMTY